MLYDDERGIEYNPWLCMNNPEIAKRINSSGATPNVYCISANQRINSEIAINLRQLLIDDRIDFLVRPDIAIDELRAHIPEYINADAQTQLYYESSYLETMLLISETAQLEYEKLEQTGLIRIRELRSAVKDRYTALSYGCYFASELERDLFKEDSFDFANIQGCVGAINF